MIALCDQAVADGTLVGQGPGHSARGRLKALRNRLVHAARRLDQGNVAAAGRPLADVANRAAGAFPPPDCGQGPAASDLFDAVTALREPLGCVHSAGARRKRPASLAPHRGAKADRTHERRTEGFMIQVGLWAMVRLTPRSAPRAWFVL